MDIMGALTTASQAIKIAKDLRDIERDIDSASYKAKMADLYSNIAGMRIALADAKEALHTKDAEIDKLRKVIENSTSGEICKICQGGRLKVTNIRPHPQFGVMGHQEHTLTCQNAECGHTEKRKVVP